MSTMNEVALLRVLQLADSALPVGSFAHSLGLETYAAAGLLQDRAVLRESLRAYLREGIAAVDGPLMVAAFRMRELAPLLDLDQLAGAVKAAREWREASRQVGQRLLELGAALWPSPLLERFAAAVAGGLAEGHQAVAAGLVYQAAGLDEETAALVFGYTGLQALVSAAVRLVPLGQREGQRLLADLHGLVREAAAAARQRTLDEIGGFSPALEIRGMQHERLYTRLFIS